MQDSNPSGKRFFSLSDEHIEEAEKLEGHDSSKLFQLLTTIGYHVQTIDQDLQLLSSCHDSKAAEDKFDSDSAVFMRSALAMFTLVDKKQCRTLGLW